MNVSLAIPDAATGSEWSELARRPLVESGHNAPEQMIPALALAPKAVLAAVHDSEGLQLALPLERRRNPFGFHASLSTPVSFFGLPHLGRYMAVPAMMALLRRLHRPVLFHSVPMDGAMWDVLTGSAGHVGILDRWERAVLRPDGTFESWFDTSFDRKRRKEYRRLQARLAEAGKLEKFSFGRTDDPAAWTAEFLDLEALGWKGKRGTALKSDPHVAAALVQALAGLAAAGKLRFWKLALDTKPIAMLFAIVEGQQAWLGKIAHDESLKRYSPGVQVILHATEQLFAEGIVQADSCAVPDHPMINHLWRGRLRVADVMIAAPSVSALSFTLTVQAERLRRRLRAIAKSTYYRLTGRQR